MIAENYIPYQSPNLFSFCWTPYVGHIWDEFQIKMWETDGRHDHYVDFGYWTDSNRKVYAVYSDGIWWTMEKTPIPMSGLYMVDFSPATHKNGIPILLTPPNQS